MIDMDDFFENFIRQTPLERYVDKLQIRGDSGDDSSEIIPVDFVYANNSFERNFGYISYHKDSFKKLIYTAFEPLDYFEELQRISPENSEKPEIVVRFENKHLGSIAHYLGVDYLKKNHYSELKDYSFIHFPGEDTRFSRKQQLKKIGIKIGVPVPFEEYHSKSKQYFKKILENDAKLAEQYATLKKIKQHSF